MSKADEQIEKPVEVFFDNTLKTLAADSFQISIRDDKSCLLRMFTHLPE